VGDGLRTTLLSYSDFSQPLSITDDNGNTTTYSYDTANRLSVVTDAKGNAMAFGYDQNANLITMTETEKSDLGGADETFVTTYAYDGLDRLIGVTDSAGNTHACAYDSRDNRVVTVDALLNETRYAYDGLDRLLVTIRDLDGDGADGDGPDIVATSVWDDNSRVVQRTDANGNATAYAYDALDRMTTRTHADGTTTSFSYNVFDERILQQTANGSVVAYAYDDCGRLTAKTITPGPGVSADTTFETFQYDGRHRLTDAENDLVHVQLGWDSLSNLVAEAINGVQTASMYDGVGNRLRLTYPGGRVVDYVYDELNRVRAIVESPDTIADYFYVGPKRIERITLGNGVQSDFQYDGRQGVPNPAGDFGVKRMIAATHSAGGTVLDSRAFQWDPLYNKTQRRDLRVGGPQLTHTYEYDAVYRLTRALVDDGSGTTIRDLQYTLDGAGNRLSVSGFGGLVGSYVLDPTLPEPADLQMNQYTATPLDQRMYDLNGNLVSRAIPGITDVQVTYDYADRVVSVVDVLSSDTATYQYDPLGRRVAKVVATGGLPPVVTRFYYDGTNVIEEQDGGGSSNRTFTISHLLEAPPELIAQVTMDTGGQRYYYHCDDMGNVVAVTDDSGAVVERYEYDDYGAPAFFDGADNPLAASLIGNEHLFVGRRYDPETGWYRCGGSYLDPLSGRFIVRRGSVWSGGGFGNPYVYAGDNPWSRSVPTTRWPYHDGSDIQGGGGDPLKGLNVSKAKPGRFGVPWVDRSWGVDADDSGWDDWSDTWGSAAPTIGHLIVPIEDAAYRTTGGRYGSVGDDLTPGWVGGYTYIKVVNTSGDVKNPQYDYDWLDDWSDTWTWGDA
ncbi:MAG: RHS repeat protein, partial [Planctomycetota bacterium]